MLVDGGRDRTDTGVTVAVDLDKLINSVYVNPWAPRWFLEVVRRATARQGVPADVRQSSLASAPVALQLSDGESTPNETNSIAYRVAVLMGEDMVAMWTELLVGFVEGQVLPNLATIARTGADPRPMIEALVTLMENSIGTVREATLGKSDP